MWEIGGFIAGGLMIVFGVAAIFMGVTGFNTTRDAIKDEGIVFGTADDPAVAEHAEQWAGEQVTTGDQARAFALVMREHVFEGTGGLTYAEMGRFVSAENPDDPAGTSDEEAALKDEEGNPSRTRRATPGSLPLRSRRRSTSATWLSDWPCSASSSESRCS